MNLVDIEIVIYSLVRSRKSYLMHFFEPFIYKVRRWFTFELMVIIVVCLLPVMSHGSLPIKSDYRPNPMFHQGLEVAVMINHNLPVIEDSVLQRKLQDIGYRVAMWAPSQSVVYSFEIIKMKEPNAFALPGGFLFVTTGMLQLQLTDGELAMLLGHEIAHVSRKHHLKMQRRSSLLAMLQQLLLVGAIVGMRDSPSHSNVAYDPRRDPADYYGSSTGKMAVVQGLATFGPLFKQMLELGFSRKFELEADSVGFEYAVKAGYKPEAQVTLMKKLHSRIYEVPGMNYWRTHPYFFDRVANAESRQKSVKKSIGLADATSFRKTSQEDFLSASRYIKKEESHRIAKKLLLEKLAYDAYPEGKLASWILRDILLAYRLTEEKKPSISRNYGELITRYDHSISRLEKLQINETELNKLKEEREKLQHEKELLLPRFLKILDRKNVDLPLLESFAENFPNHPRMQEVYTRLGRHYRLSGKVKKAANALLKAHYLQGSKKWKALCEKQLSALFATIKDPSLCMELMEVASEEDKKTLHKTIQDIIEHSLTLEKISDFLSAWSDSSYAAVVYEKWEKVARKEYLKGRVLEASKEYQKALDVYNRVASLASPTAAGKEARKRIEYLSNQEQ